MCTTVSKFLRTVKVLTLKTAMAAENAFYNIKIHLYIKYKMINKKKTVKQ